MATSAACSGVVGAIVRVGRIVEDEDIRAKSLVATSDFETPRIRRVLERERSTRSSRMTMSVTNPTVMRLRSRRRRSEMTRMRAHVNENIIVLFGIGSGNWRRGARNIATSFTDTSTEQNTAIISPWVQRSRAAGNRTIRERTGRSSNVSHVEADGVAVGDSSSHQRGRKGCIVVVPKVCVHLLRLEE